MMVLRFTTASIATLAIGLSLSLVPALSVVPASAQSAEERVNQLIVYGDDPCPQSTDAEITVCARKDESERYRIPEPLREPQSPQNDAWNNRVIAYETVGKNGTMSCSPVGAGGWTGCLTQMIETAYAQKDTDASVRFSELIAEERARRLATIDDKAERQQAEVEEAEREYFQGQNQDQEQQNSVPAPSADE